MSYLIIGLGKSGLSATEFLQKKGQFVVIFDDNHQKYFSKKVLKLIENGAEIFDKIWRVLLINSINCFTAVSGMVR